MDFLKVENMDLAYGSIKVLRGVNLKVDEGEIVSIIGPNGAGKTSLLRVISGVVHPVSGTISFLGERIDKLPPYSIVKKGIAHIPEGARAFPYMTVQENLDMGAYTVKDKKERESSFEQIFNLFPILKERRKQLANTLSGGERQMLSIGRSLMLKPKLLMLDEPSFALAPKIVSKIFEVTKDIHEKGITILLVEQNAYQALNLSDRSYLLEVGRIVKEGKVEDFLKDDYVRRSYLGLD